MLRQEHGIRERKSIPLVHIAGIFLLGASCYPTGQPLKGPLVGTLAEEGLLDGLDNAEQKAIDACGLYTGKIHREHPWLFVAVKAV